MAQEANNEAVIEARDASDKGTFILELEMVVDEGTSAELTKRLEVARKVYNACLGECIGRKNRMVASQDWKTARAMKGKERGVAFRACEKRFGFTDYDMQAWTKQFNVRGLWLADHLDSQVNKALASRAFKTVKRALLEGGNPRFRRYGEMDSVHAINNNQSIRWRDGRLLWKGLEISVAIPENDARVQHGLACRVKYPVIVRREIRGKTRWFCNLVLEGKPYLDPVRVLGRGIVGIDLGPQTIAVVADNAASLEVLAPRAASFDAEIRRLMRRFDRQRRANNPENYDEKGRVKPPAQRKPWKTSARMERTRAKLKDINRRLTATRKTCHGELVHRILALGNDIRIEKLSYKAWQAMFGKSIGARGPGEFVRILKYRAALVDATVTEIETRTTKLSQSCQCGAVVKKPLSQRWHDCPCGVRCQRDLYSAFLARFVEGNRLDAASAQKAWPGVEPLLWTASSSLQPTIDGHLPQSLGSGRGNSRPSSNMHESAVEDATSGAGGNSGDGCGEAV